MKDGHLPWHEIDSIPYNDVIIILTKEGRKEQVTLEQDDFAYEWRYGKTNTKVCHASKIDKWRGCTGFDF